MRTKQSQTRQLTVLEIKKGPVENKSSGPIKHIPVCSMVKTNTKRIVDGVVECPSFISARW